MSQQDNDIRIALIGDERGIRDALPDLKYPELVDIYRWENSTFFTMDWQAFIQYDIYIIALQYRNNLSSITEMICRLSGVNEGCVLDYYRIKVAVAPRRKVDQKLFGVQKGMLDGLIFGISHADVGIIEQRLPGNFINLAVSSQDLYSNFKVMEYLSNNYFCQIENIKTIFFDLFDYSFFNYDASMTLNYPGYLEQGGFDFDEHNYSKGVVKRDTGLSFKEMNDIVEARRLERIQPDSIQLWEIIGEFHSFDTCHDDITGALAQSERVRMVEQQEVDSFRLGKYVNSTYEATISENVRCMESFLEIVNKISADVKVYGVIIPRYYGVRKQEAVLDDYWKPIFYELMERFEGKYNFRFIDFREDEISKDYRYYYDSAHLNVFGAMRFTDYLIQYCS